MPARALTEKQKMMLAELLGVFDTVQWDGFVPRWWAENCDQRVFRNLVSRGVVKADAGGYRIVGVGGSRCPLCGKASVARQEEMRL